VRAHSYTMHCRCRELPHCHDMLKHQAIEECMFPNAQTSMPGMATFTHTHVGYNCRCDDYCSTGSIASQNAPLMLHLCVRNQWKILTHQLNTSIRPNFIQANCFCGHKMHYLGLIWQRIQVPYASSNYSHVRSWSTSSCEGC